MHALGRGTAPDVAKAIECYRAAAELGDARAMSNLGALALEGRGLPKDEVVAMGWFVKAAERGDGDAMHRLAVIHAARRGDASVRDACFWATLAGRAMQGQDARGGDRGARRFPREARRSGAARGRRPRGHLERRPSASWRHTGSRRAVTGRAINDKPRPSRRGSSRFAFRRVSLSPRRRPRNRAARRGRSRRWFRCPSHRSGRQGPSRRAWS